MKHIFLIFFIIILILKANLLAKGEFLIDTTIIYIPARYEQCSSSIAFDGTNYLVVWQDYRSTFNESDIYCARISVNGILIDSAGILVTDATGDQKFPSVAFGGINYLIVWEDERNGFYSDIYGARLTPDGELLDSEGILISNAPNRQCFPSVVFDGTNYFVVWEDYRNGNFDIYGARVTQEGIVLDTNGIQISTAPGQQLSPSLSFDNTNYLIVWADNRNGSNYDIYGARVSINGTVLDPNGIPISTASWDQRFPSIVFGNSNYLVVWSDSRNSPWTSDIYGARVSVEGIVLDPAGIPISTATDYQDFPSVAFDGTNYFVTWEDWRVAPDIYGARVNTNGIVLDPNGIPISTASLNQFFPSVAFDGTNYFVVWQDCRSGYGFDIYGARVDRNGNVLDPNGILISLSGDYRYHPSAIFGGTNYFVVWVDYRDNPWKSNIYGARLSIDGNVIDPNGISISNAINSQRYPSAGFDGTNYLVVWEDYRNNPMESDIYGARVNINGTIIDPNGIVISAAPNYQCIPSLAFDGVNYLVVWKDYRNGASDIYGARVNPNGTVLDPNGIPISTALNSQERPKMAFDGTNYLVVWEDYRGTTSDIYGARVSPNGTVLDPNGIPISTAPAYQYFPSITFDGTNYFVVWADERTDPLYSDIYGARITPNGTILDPNGIPISTAPNFQTFPSVAFDGTNYIVIWEDYRNGCADIYGAKVSTSGVVIDSFPISLHKGNQIRPSLIRGIENQLLITYSGFTPYVNNRPANTMRIWGKLYPFTKTEENSFIVNNKCMIPRIIIDPFSHLIQINYFLPKSSYVLIQLYNVTGECIKTLIKEKQNAGYHKIMWNIKDYKNKYFTTGTYFLWIKIENSVFQQKLIFLR